MNNFGTVDYKGITLTLTQQAYLSHNCDDGSFYRAHAEDEKGNEYDVTWEITNEVSEDESDACDWSNCKVKEL